MESVLASLAADPKARARVEGRLRGAVARIQALLAGAADGGDGRAGDDLGSVSDEEMFELIDKEIGS